MRPTQRIEIIIDRHQVEPVTDIFQRHHLSGWTELRVEAGAGERGERRDDDISGSSSSRLLLTTCRPEKIQELVDDLRPVLQRYGGVCLVSEARWVIR